MRYLVRVKRSVVGEEEEYPEYRVSEYKDLVFDGDFKENNDYPDAYQKELSCMTIKDGYVSWTVDQIIAVEAPLYPKFRATDKVFEKFGMKWVLPENYEIMMGRNIAKKL